MAIFYNKSDGYLWEKGMAPVLAWLVVLIGGYFLFYLYHGFVIGISNDYLTILWGIMTLWLMVYWLRMGDNLLESVYSWLIGYIGEWILRRKLRNLSDDYHIIYGYKIPGRNDNIDFVVICKYGIFSLEVKSFLRIVETMSGWWVKKGVYQSKKQSERLKKYLEEKKVFVSKVYAVLVFAFQEEFEPIKNNDLLVFGKISLISFFEDSLPKNNAIYDDKQISNIVEALNKPGDRSWIGTFN